MAGLTSGPNTTNPQPKMWLYASADPIATVQGAGYFSDGIQRGLMVNDIVFVVDTNLVRVYLCIVVGTTPAPTTDAFGGVGVGSVTLNSTTTPVAD
jgi:hypothetical protein